MNAIASPDPLEELTEDCQTAEEWAAEANRAFTRGDISGMRRCLESAVELAPKDGQLALSLGHAELSEGNLEAALAAYWRATLLLKNSASAYACHALAASLLGRKAEASSSAVRAISLDPTEAVGLKVLARIHLDSAQPEAARLACQLVLQLHPDDEVAMQLLEEVQVQEAKLAENLAERPTRRVVMPPSARRKAS